MNEVILNNQYDHIINKADQYQATSLTNFTHLKQNCFYHTGAKLDIFSRIKKMV